MNSLLPRAYVIPLEERGDEASDPPRCVFIEVTNRCNLQCRTCPRTFTALEPPHTLSWEEFSGISDQFQDMERAVLHGVGEPLLNPNLPEMVAHLKRRGATVLFNTNGTLLTETRGLALALSGLDELRVSMDAASSNTFVRMRGRPLFDRVVSNLVRFVAVQRREGTSTRVSLWLTGTTGNVAELPGLVDLAARIGVPEVYMQRLVYPLDSPSPPGLMAASYTASTGHAAMEDTIAAAEEKARVLGIALRASGATDPRHSLDLQSADARPWLRCARPWTTAYVTANGNCLPCCMGPFATADYPRLKMGNLFGQSFESIWNGALYREWRRAMLSGQAPVPCTGCGVLWSL